MKICNPKVFISKCPKINYQTSATKFWITAVDFYLSLIGNCLILVGYLLAKIGAEGFHPYFTCNFLILVGHCLAVVSDTCTFIQDIVSMKDIELRDFTVNRFFVVANVLSIIGEYQEMRATWREHNTT